MFSHQCSPNLYITVFAWMTPFILITTITCGIVQYNHGMNLFDLIDLCLGLALASIFLITSVLECYRKKSIMCVLFPCHCNKKITDNERVPFIVGDNVVNQIQ
ncbi:Hypothetical_protein [Hexamita inflata]|uniref:Hypothetical_protein n=1 Tax=Hexamita inflata TaxID=28002 RepID=A0AA86PN80_9EUKA|nr:Hypothetical protein HINF_LOCUS30231 [Hexamita inflata]